MADYHWELQEINRSLIRIAKALEERNKRATQPVVVNIENPTPTQTAHALVTQAKLVR